MNNSSISILLSLFLLSFGMPTVAQENQSVKKQKREIIIREGADSTQKMTIIINGDKVTLNGKELAGEEKDQFIIKRRKNGLPMPDAFIFEEDASDFSMERSENNNKPSLGVLAGKGESGAEVLEVLPGSPAEKAGIKVRDMIIAVSGKKITGPQELSETIKSKKPSEEVEIQYVRDGMQMTANVTLEAGTNLSRNFPGEMPLGRPKRIMIENMFENGMGEDQYLNFIQKSRPKLGIEIQETEDERGVKITDVETGSVAEKSGLKKGDIILSIDQQKIAGLSDAKSAIGQDKHNLNLNVLRDGKAMQLEIKLPRDLKKAKL
jgi:serine protease Do